MGKKQGSRNSYIALQTTQFITERKEQGKQEREIIAAHVRERENPKRKLQRSEKGKGKKNTV